MGAPQHGDDAAPRPHPSHISAGATLVCPLYASPQRADADADAIAADAAAASSAARDARKLSTYNQVTTANPRRNGHSFFLPNAPRGVFEARGFVSDCPTVAPATADAIRRSKPAPPPGTVVAAAPAAVPVAASAPASAPAPATT